MNAAAFSANLGDATLSEGVAASPRNRRATVQFAALSGSGETVGVIDVQRVIGGYWATSHVEQCA